MNDNIFWVIYRDDSTRELLMKVRGCLDQFERKMRMKGNVVGVASSLSEEGKYRLEVDGLRVVFNLPAWEKSEIWVGREVKENEHG